MRITTLKDEKCFITGAASGLGRATAEACAAEGAELYLTDINARALEAVVQRIRQGGGWVGQYRAFDVADPRDGMLNP